ncbi:uncharacterized protein FHX37_2974 [Haloactinospora alba]|uniref:HD domain-containing protein n=1 Tax=Haloactinospora alba TaxID=405555 RepID=A0A543NMC1_9ACTN|nr:HDIG domain-containing metalloprotein [Haloactinospora alba]TQN32982.1 uncharacterized protein FHX37_2974 [Haloactinospora alba]
MVIPSDKEIRLLHERYAPSTEVFEKVYSHCAIVCDIAEQLIERQGLALDLELVRAGALLHDIGVYRLGGVGHDNYLRHGVLGHRILAEEGFPEELCRFCSCHTGVGLTRDDVRLQGIPIPEADYVAETGEEEIVMYADKFHSKKEPPVLVSADSYSATARGFGADKAAAFQTMRERYGDPDLTPFMDG